MVRGFVDLKESQEKPLVCCFGNQTTPRLHDTTIFIYFLNVVAQSTHIHRLRLILQLA